MRVYRFTPGTEKAFSDDRAGQLRSRYAYYAQPTSTNASGHQPCLGACGRTTRGPYCTTCEKRFRP